MFALLTSFSVSNGLLLLFMLGIFSWLLLTGKRRYIFTTIGFVIAVNVLLGIFYEWWYVNAVADRSKIYPELGMKELLARFRYLDPFYFYRFAFLIFPCGIIPALSLIMVNWQDKIARIIICCTCSIFFLFYINGFIVLHYFVPAMILPLIVFWRIYLSKNDRFKRICLPLVFISTTVSLYLSLPESFEIDRTSREFGYATDYRIGNYNSDYWLAMKYAGVIHCAIQGDWLLEDPGHEWGTTPDRWIYYAMQPKPEENQINYIVQLEDKAPPEGYTLFGKEREACFYVRDIERLLQYKYKENHVDYKSPLYDIPRSEMFYHLRIKEPLIDLKKFFRHTF